MKKSKFNLTHLHSATLDAGYLVPFLLQPTLPNDTFRIGLSTFLRAQPMLAPLMHEVYLNTQYWFVPYRLLWDSWEDFITGGSDLSSTPNFPVVVSTAEDAKVGSLWDYFGFPLEAGVEVSALPFRAIAEIWNTRYRDQDLQSEVPVSYASGLDSITSRQLLSPCISKDYFSVSRPFTQRGADIFVPITASDSTGNPIYHKHDFSILAFVAYYYYKVTDATRTVPPTTFKGNWKNVYSNVVCKVTGKIVWFGREVPVGTYRATDADISNFATCIAFLSHSAGPGTITGLDYNQITSDLKALLNSSLNNDLVPFGSYSFSYSGSGAGNPSGTVTYSNYPFLLKSTLENDTTVPTLPADVFPSISSIIDCGSSNKVKVLKIGDGQACGTEDGLRSKVTLGVALKQSGSLSIRSLRESSALQRYAERSLKYGNRYEEFIQREFGISPRDSRIQRPEYLGGGRGLLNISEVLQTAESTDTGVGTMRGHGVGAITQRRIKFKSPEHGIIIGLLSIRPKIVYTQGVDREFLKRSRLDFFTPELANIGMQEVLTQEIYADSANKGQIFGYSDRYQEYRYHKPLVTGEFRGNLNFWNMALEFATQPELTGEFISMKTYVDNWKRPFQIQDNSAHAFVCMLKNHIRAYRPIPKRSKDILR